MRKAVYIILITLLIALSLPLSVSASVDQIPRLEVYQQNGSVKLEWAVEMLDANVLVKTSFEQGELLPDFLIRDSTQYQEGVNTTVASSSTNRESIKVASGWVDKKYFEDGKGVSAIPLNLGDKFSRYTKMKDGRYRLEHNIRTNGNQVISTETAYSGKSSYKIGVTTPTFGNYFWFPGFNNRNSYGVFPKLYQIKNDMDLSLTFRAKTDKMATFTPLMHGGMSSWTYPLHEIYGFKTPLKVTKPAKKGDKRIYVTGVEQLTWNTPYYVTNRVSRTNTVEHGYWQITDFNKDEGWIEIAGSLSEDWNVGYILHRHQNRTPVEFNTRTITAKDGWALFNINTKVKNYEDYDSSLLGLSLWMLTASDGNTFIDDVKLGFATRVELYRDNSKIYEGFLSDFTDTQAKDKAKPNKAESYTVSKTNGKSFISLKEPKDNGTSYNYSVKAIANNGTTYTSAIKPINILSGLKGYSYVIDQQPNTVPNGAINSTDGKIEIPITANQSSYLHVQSIDNAGNKSDVAHFPLRDVIKEELELNIPTIKPFGEITLSEQPKVYSTSFNSNVKIKSHYLNENNSWRLNISATPLKLSNNTYQLPKGTMKLKPLTSIKRITGSGLLPNNLMSNDVIIDDGTKTIVQSVKKQGVGEFELVFPDNSLQITIDPTTAKVGAYQSTLTWDLISAP